MTGLYLHIPFCLRKCPYCDFYSVPLDDDRADRYVAVLASLLRSRHFPLGRVDTVYLGGGTPSLLGADRIAALLDAVSASCSLASDTEVTLEVNPATARQAGLADWRAAGVNRLSIGVQSGSDSELRALGRLHSAADAAGCIQAAHQAGFDNLSADLMLAVPGQTRASLSASIRLLASLPVAHVSAYLLKVEEGTPFARQQVEVDDDSGADRYLQAVEELAAAGLPQYEISNFARPGRESRHNLKYWRLEPYLGLGPAAHSFLDGRRFHFARDLSSFLRDPFSCLEQDGDGGGLDEYAMLCLRLTEGLDLNQASRRYGRDADALRSRAGPFLASGHARLEGDRLSLTPKGFLVSNTIITALLG